MAFKAQWIIRLFHPRYTFWKELIELWLEPYPLAMLIQSTSQAQKQKILKKIPNEYFRECVQAFWNLDIRPNVNYDKIENGDEILSMPPFDNGLFTVNIIERTKETFLHPLLNMIGYF